MAIRSSSNAKRHPYLLMANWTGNGSIDLRFWISTTENHQSYTKEQQNQLEEGLNDVELEFNGYVKVINKHEHLHGGRKNKLKT